MGEPAAATGYEERVSSRRTEALFVALTLGFLGLAGWRGAGHGWDGWTITFACLSGVFLFYSLNFRTLRLQITAEQVELRFGIFCWRIACEEIAACRLDETSLWRIGGAGIHFTPLQGRYRAMFNFLEHPRVVLALKRKHGVVQDIAFSTRQPDKVMRLIRGQANIREK